jgi:hypothetical protein
MKNFRLQSAMEYLMTYGWAILIIAVVLVALFSLGVFSGGVGLGNSCIAQSGFLCQNPLLHSTGFTFTVGQSTGTNWASANVLWVPQGSTSPANSQGCTGMEGVNTISTGVTCNTITNGLSSGATTAVNLQFSSAATTGSTYAGALWVYYSTGSGVEYQAKLASVTLKAV